MNFTTKPSSHSLERHEWKSIVDRYRQPVASRSTWQLISTLVPFAALTIAMYWSLDVSYLLTLLLAVPTACFCVRLFIISHDCGHQSYFKARRLNNFWGELTAGLVWTPYVYWRNEHARHHGSAGNLDRRGIGDIWTLTVDEYKALPLFTRMRYRIYRFPPFLFILAPVYQFMVGYRFWGKWAGPTERLSILRTNLYIVAVMALCHWTIGLKAFFLIELPVTAFAASFGVWLFYVQHQFEEVYWEKSDKWDFVAQALEGSSYYKLPRILEWFSASIGFHHVHHLGPRIPNYNLARCHHENTLFHGVNVITFTQSLKLLNYRLWDVTQRKMVGFRGGVSRQAPQAKAA